MLHPRPIWFVLVLVTLALPHSGAAQDDDLHIIEFETTEVTAPDVAVSPDGEVLIFTMLGHLFRLPVAGGTAEQLTFGPYYDSDPAFSPDGRRVAFVSDRDGSEGNVFLLDVATGRISQLTHEPWAGRPAWTPDGRAVAYLEFLREAAAGSRQLSGYLPIPSVVKQIEVDGSEPEPLSSGPGLYRSIDFLADGRAVWSIVKRDPLTDAWVTRIQATDGTSSHATLRELDGFVDRIVADPLSVVRVFARHFRLAHTWLPWHATERLVELPLGGGTPVALLPTVASYSGNRFAVSPDGAFLFTGHAGRLWKIRVSDGARSPIPLRVKVRLELAPRTTAIPLDPRTTGEWLYPQNPSHPSISSAGERLYFQAANHVFEHRTGADQTARRVFQGKSREMLPALSPDGNSLAYVWSDGSKEEVRVFEFASGKERTVASKANFNWPPAWRPDGRKLLVTEYGGGPPKVVAIDLETGARTIVVAGVGYLRRPHYSHDGTAVFFTSRLQQRWTTYRLSLKKDGIGAQPVAELEADIFEGLVSPDGKWFVFRGRQGLSAAPMRQRPVRSADVRLLTAELVETFSISPDGSEVVYSNANGLWRVPLEGGEPEAIPAQPRLARQVHQPLLVRRVRLLDFERHLFTPEASLYIEDGQIVWVGSEQSREIPAQAVILDAAGRYAIPGLFDFHAHGGWSGPAGQTAFIAHGVTSVRDPGSSLAVTRALASRGEAAGEPIPRYFSSGIALQGAGSGGTAIVDNEPSARRYVSARKQAGAHFIKIYPSLSWPLQHAALRAANSAGLPPAGHGMSVEEIVRGLTRGYSTLEHSRSSGRVYGDVLLALVSSGTRWDPTLVMQMGSVLLLREEPERLEDAILVAFSSQECRDAALSADLVKAEGDMMLRGMLAERLASVYEAHAAGVLLQAGTDDHGAPWLCLPGVSLHWELELLGRAGIEPAEVIKIATLQAAEALGVDAHLGSLEAGKLADIVLLDANPLDDIRNTRAIWRVIKGGWLYDPDKLRPPESVKMTE